MESPDYEGPDRRRAPGTVLHVCTQEQRLTLVDEKLGDFAEWRATQNEWQKNQNGTLIRQERIVDEIRTIILNRLPQDLPTRLSQVEADGNQKRGAVNLARWMVALLGAGSLAAIVNFLFSDGGPMHFVTQWLGG